MENLSDWTVVRQDSNQMELEYRGTTVGKFLIGLSAVIFIFTAPTLFSQIQAGFRMINETTFWGLAACVSLLTGIYSLFSYGTVVFDKTRKTMRISRKKLLYSSDDERSLQGAKEILYYSEWRSSSKSRNQYWFVELVIDGGENIRLGNLVEGEALMRACAEKFSKFFGLPLHDKTGETERIIPCEELDVPLTEKMKTVAPPDIDSLRPPAGSGIEVGTQGDSLRIFLPPSRHGIFIFVFCLLWGGGSISFFLIFLSSAIKALTEGGNMPPAVLIIMSVFFALLGSFMIVGSYRGLSDREEILISRTGIEKAVVNNGKRNGVESIPLDKVEEIRLTDRSGASQTHGSFGISIVSDERIIKVGGSLKPAETEWLSGALRNAVSGMK